MPAWVWWWWVLAALLGVALGAGGLYLWIVSSLITGLMI